MPADKAKITREYVNKLEAGRYDPTLGVLKRLARALGVSLAALIEAPMGEVNMDRRRLERDLLDARKALIGGKGIVGMSALAGRVEKLGAVYRTHAKVLRDSMDSESRISAITMTLDQLNGPPRS